MKVASQAVLPVCIRARASQDREIWWTVTDYICSKAYKKHLIPPGKILTFNALTRQFEKNWEIKDWLLQIHAVMSLLFVLGSGRRAVTQLYVALLNMTKTNLAALSVSWTDELDVELKWL